MRRRTVVEVQAPLPLAPPLQPTRFPIYSQIGKLKRQYLEIRSKTSFVRQVSPKNFFSLGPTSPLGIYEVRKPEPVHPEGLLSREDEKRAIEQFKLLIVVVNRLAERYRETKTKRGTLLEYHQKIPLLAAFGGFAAMRLGVEGVNRWRKELEEIFCTVNFDSKQEVKFGRRSGKTYMASLIIACLLCTQVKCNGIFMCVDKALASENADTITYFITEILEDPKQPIRGKIVKGSRSEGIVRVETQFGTNKVRCSTDPKRSSIRGKGDNRGFFFVDESDFFEQKAWDQIQPIWSMPMLVALYTSQGYTMSPANKMIQNAVLANGERIWRQYRITPGRISLIISEDYDRTTRDSTGRLLFGLPDENTSNRHGASHGKGGGGGSNANGADNTEALPIRSIRRPWYDPVMQTLSDRMTELTIQEDERRNRLSLLTTTTTTEHLRYHTTLPTLPYHSIETTRTIAKNNAELEALITKEIRDGASVWSAGECVWLMTLPAQQDPGNMIRLRAMMGKEAFDREMLSAAPDTGISLYPTFDEEDITKLFLLENRRSIFPTSTGGPIRWIIGFDPGGSGPNQQSASDTVIVSALIFPPEDPRNSPHGIDRMQSLSLRQQLVVRGGKVGEGCRVIWESNQPQCPRDLHLSYI